MYVGCTYTYMINSGQLRVNIIQIKVNKLNYSYCFGQFMMLIASNNEQI